MSVLQNNPRRCRRDKKHHSPLMVKASKRDCFYRHPSPLPVSSSLCPSQFRLYQPLRQVMPPRKRVRADGDEEGPTSAETHSSPMGISTSTQLTAPRPRYATLPHRSHTFNGRAARASKMAPSTFFASGSFTLTASSNFPSAAAPFTLPPPPIPALRNLPFSPTSEPNVPSEVEDELMEDLSSFPLSSVSGSPNVLGINS